MAKKITFLFCKQPDRHVPRLKCGYPLPCPWHTAIIHADKNPPTVELPTTAISARKAKDKLKNIALVFGE